MPSEHERARRSESAFQWEFPEPDRQVFRAERRKGRHRVERHSQSKETPRQAAAQPEPLQADPEPIQRSPRADSAGGPEPPVAEPQIEAASELPPSERKPKPESKRSSETPSPKALAQRDKAEKRRQSTKTTRVKEGTASAPMPEATAKGLEVAPASAPMPESKLEPAPEPLIQEPAPQPDEQESPRPKRRRGFGRREKLGKRPSAEPAPAEPILEEPQPQPEPQPEPEPQPQPVPEEPQPQPEPEPEPVLGEREPAPEPEPERQAFVSPGQETEFFELAGVSLVVVGMPFIHRDRVAEAIGVEPQRVRWLPSATGAEAFLSDNRDSTFVLLLTPQIKREDAFGMAEYVARLDPSTGVVLLGDRSDERFLLTALRAGVREVVDPNAPAAELRHALERVMDTSARIRSTRGTRMLEPAQGNGTIVSLFSSKGGTGKTFLAANLATALAARSRADTAVVDLDLALGDTVSYFGAEAPLDIEKFLALSEWNDRVAMRRAGLQVGDHLWAYATKPDSATSNHLSGEAVAKTLRTLQRNFAYTVVDTAPVYDEKALAALDLADVICLVAALDVVAIRHLSSAFTTLLSLGIPPGRFLVVLNRADSKVHLSASDVERVLRFHADALIPSSRLVPLSLNRGRPVYLDEPRSNVSKGIAGLAERIRRLYPQVPEFGDPEASERPARRGLFRKP